jgi:hypothetical protein
MDFELSEGVRKRVDISMKELNDLYKGTHCKSSSSSDNLSDTSRQTVSTTVENTPVCMRLPVLSAATVAELCDRTRSPPAPDRERADITPIPPFPPTSEDVDNLFSGDESSNHAIMAALLQCAEAVQKKKREEETPIFSVLPDKDAEQVVQRFEDIVKAFTNYPISFPSSHKTIMAALYHFAREADKIPALQAVQEFGSRLREEPDLVPELGENQCGCAKFQWFNDAIEEEFAELHNVLTIIRDRDETQMFVVREVYIDFIRKFNGITFLWSIFAYELLSCKNKVCAEHSKMLSQAETLLAEHKSVLASLTLAIYENPTYSFFWDSLMLKQGYFISGLIDATMDFAFARTEEDCQTVQLVRQSTQLFQEAVDLKKKEFQNPVPFSEDLVDISSVIFPRARQMAELVTAALVPNKSRRSADGARCSCAAWKQVLDSVLQRLDRLIDRQTEWIYNFTLYKTQERDVSLLNYHFFAPFLHGLSMRRDIVARAWFLRHSCAGPTGEHFRSNKVDTDLEDHLKRGTKLINIFKRFMTAAQVEGPLHPFYGISKALRPIPKAEAREWALRHKHSDVLVDFNLNHYQFFPSPMASDVETATNTALDSTFLSSRRNQYADATTTDFENNTVLSVSSSNSPKNLIDLPLEEPNHPQGGSCNTGRSQESRASNTFRSAERSKSTDFVREWLEKDRKEEERRKALQDFRPPRRETRIHDDEDSENKENTAPEVPEPNNDPIPRPQVTTTPAPLLPSLQPPLPKFMSQRQEQRVHKSAVASAGLCSPLLRSARQAFNRSVNTPRRQFSPQRIPSPNKESQQWSRGKTQSKEYQKKEKRQSHNYRETSAEDCKRKKRLSKHKRDRRSRRQGYGQSGFSSSSSSSQDAPFDISDHSFSSDSSSSTVRSKHKKSRNQGDYNGYSSPPHPDSSDSDSSASNSSYGFRNTHRSYLKKMLKKAGVKNTRWDDCEREYDHAGSKPTTWPEIHQRALQDLDLRPHEVTVERAGPRSEEILMANKLCVMMKTHPESMKEDYTLSVADKVEAYASKMRIWESQRRYGLDNSKDKHFYYASKVLALAKRYEEFLKEAEKPREHRFHKISAKGSNSARPKEFRDYIMKAEQLSDIYLVWNQAAQLKRYYNWSPEAFYQVVERHINVKHRDLLRHCVTNRPPRVTHEYMDEMCSQHTHMEYWKKLMDLRREPHDTLHGVMIKAICYVKEVRNRWPANQRVLKEKAFLRECLINFTGQEAKQSVKKYLENLDLRGIEPPMEECASQAQRIERERGYVHEVSIGSNASHILVRAAQEEEAQAPPFYDKKRRISRDRFSSNKPNAVKKAQSPSPSIRFSSEERSRPGSRRGSVSPMPLRMKPTQRGRRERRASQDEQQEEAVCLLTDYPIGADEHEKGWKPAWINKKEVVNNPGSEKGYWPVWRSPSNRRFQRRTNFSNTGSGSYLDNKSQIYTAQQFLRLFHKCMEEWKKAELSDKNQYPLKLRNTSQDPHFGGRYSRNQSRNGGRDRRQSASPYSRRDDRNVSAPLLQTPSHQTLEKPPNGYSAPQTPAADEAATKAKLEAKEKEVHNLLRMLEREQRLRDDSRSRRERERGVLSTDSSDSKRRRTEGDSTDERSSSGPRSRDDSLLRKILRAKRRGVPMDVKRTLLSPNEDESASQGHEGEYFSLSDLDLDNEPEN